VGLVFGDWGLMFEIWGLEYVAYGRKYGDSFTCFASCLQTQKGAKTSPKKTETAWAAAAAAAAARLNHRPIRSDPSKITALKHVKRHTSPITRHPSHVTRHTSSITRHLRLSNQRNNQQIPTRLLQWHVFLLCVPSHALTSHKRHSLQKQNPKPALNLGVAYGRSAMGQKPK